MSDRNNQDTLKSLLQSAYRPVRPSPAFRKRLVVQIMQEKQLPASVYTRFFRFSPVTWVALAAVIAIAMIVYGILSVPVTPDVIYSAPFPPLS